MFSNTHILSLLALAALGFASVLITDPSNVISDSAWISDNAILADYNVTAGGSYLLTALAATTYIDDTDVSVSYVTYSTYANDSSALSIAGGAVANISHANIVKFGYSSNLNQASFFGVNAAINVANASKLNIDHVNITTHNGAAGIYAYGADTVVTVNNLWSYSSGPVAHGLYASDGGVIDAANVNIYSGGNRASATSGDNGGGYLRVRDSVLHTSGIGSALTYAVGQSNLTNVVGIAERSPAMFMDGIQYASFTDCDLTAGLLGGTIQFSSATRDTGSVVVFVDSKLNVTGSTMPALWFGNVIGSTYLTNTEIVTSSGILVVANYSQVTQDFDYYAGYEDNNDLSPAEATVYVTSSTLKGDLVAYNESTISFNLDEHSSWTGKAYSGYGTSYFGLTIDSTSNWTLTADTSLLNFTDVDTTLSNIHSGGYTLYYNSTVNSWLGGKTVSLSGGGYAKPL